MADPLNILVLDQLRTLTGLEVFPVVSTPSDIMHAIDLYYMSTIDLDKEVGEIKEVAIEPIAKEEELDVFKLTELSQGQTIITTVNTIISEAIKQGASDIHCEPFENNLRIRYRIDGMLRESNLISKEIQEALIARLKIMSRLDITQRRLSQDGRFSINFEQRDIDFRVSVLPTHFGEKIVLRILDKGSMKLDLESLGFSANPLGVYQTAIQSPFGMLLITGPTGSGKSTSLYSMLSRLNNYDKNIVTIEDPIEYYLSGITQIQVKPEIGLSFANCLRSVLRQSPDIIMLGEIRDTETADIAMKAALTGHLVLSTLHTNDAPSSITRLMDMGIEPFLIAGSIRLASAQRLCRRLCADCKTKYTLEAAEITRRISLPVEGKQVELYKPAGCPQCNKSGYKGRVAIVEAFLVDDNIREMILSRLPSVEIKKYVQEKQGMHTLREDGLGKALSGETSLEEVLRVSAEF
jgi:type IV pilus assembly protein PilB